MVPPQWLGEFVMGSTRTTCAIFQDACIEQCPAGSRMHQGNVFCRRLPSSVPGVQEAVSMIRRSESGNVHLGALVVDTAPGPPGYKRHGVTTQCIVVHRSSTCLLLLLLLLLLRMLLLPVAMKIILVGIIIIITAFGWADR